MENFSPETLLVVTGLCILLSLTSIVCQLKFSHSSMVHWLSGGLQLATGYVIYTAVLAIASASPDGKLALTLFMAMIIVLGLFSIMFGFRVLIRNHELVAA